MGGGMKMIAALALFAVVVPAVDAAAATATRKVSRRIPARPAASADWKKHVVLTANGGFLVGNPAAKVKFVEFGSLTCPYCQRFHQEAIASLRDRIATGRVSFEFHPFAVHSSDAILHALLRCAGAARYLKFSDDFYDGQATLAAAYETWAEANPSTNPNATAADRIKYAGQWGFTAFAATHGLTNMQVTACLSNTAALEQQQQREDTISKQLGVQSTPTFFLNGLKMTTYSWPEIDQAIVAALR